MAKQKCNLCKNYNTASLLDRNLREAYYACVYLVIILACIMLIYFIRKNGQKQVQKNIFSKEM